jgi:hypothetical protein
MQVMLTRSPRLFSLPALGYEGGDAPRMQGAKVALA